MVIIVSIDDFDAYGIETSGQAAKLAVFGSVVSLIGDAIVTYAAALAVEEQQNAPDTGDVMDELNELKQQMSELTRELKKARQNEQKDPSHRDHAGG
ncbi:hypothetical protein NCCP2716_01000 [Sporosarcina sp. NCCP-2716]|uniref:hypothetical protein n=1 Tax=Sporosarcina sp. NCCP-2716 TaxID=2943679 RepID=UPI00203E5541|nr:hypothetical protein [Sporosarcina sp. NCCP-2716]GKV67602.1 hypothetical protein NCCP2716_01000 [Sporosarcina sp. NCCP-2716]